MNNENQLLRNLGFLGGLGLAIGLVVGSGLFGVPGLSIEQGGPFFSFWAWLGTSVVSLPFIYVFSKLGLILPTADGLSGYAELAVGRWARYSVTYILIGAYALGMPALILIGAAYTAKLFGLPATPWMTFLVSMGFLFVITLLNCLGTRFSSWINTLSFVLLAFLLGLILFYEPKYWVTGGLHVFQPSLLIDSFFSGNFLASSKIIWGLSSLVFWAYQGWENLSFCLEEIKHPEKNIPRVFWASFILVVILYLALAIVASGAYLEGLGVGATAGFEPLLSRIPGGKIWLTLTVIVVLANGNAWIWAGSRLVFAAGRDRILPKYFAKLTKGKLPVRSLLVLSSIYLVVLLIATAFDISVQELILMANAGNISLSFFAIIAFWKTEKNRVSRWLVTLLCFFGTLLLCSGFGAGVLYPVLLLVLGYLVYFNAKAKT